MKRCNCFLVIIITSILNINNAYSQTKFETGYVIDIQKDTIKGSIEYQNWDKTPKAIAFRSNNDSKSTICTPENIQSFSVAGERYVRAIVTIDESPSRDNELSDSETPQYKTDTVFLHVLIDGTKSLYYLKDKNLKEHFFIGQNGTYTTLVLIKYLNKVDGVTFIQKKELFKGQLNIYLQECSSIQKKINSVSYSKNDLIKLFNEYYKCTQEKTAYQPELDKIKSEFGILGGLSLTNLKFTGSNDNITALINTDYPYSKNFTFGGFFNIILPRKQGRLSFNNELIFTSYKVSGMNLDSYNVYIYTNTYSSIGYSYIKLNNLFKIKFPVKKIFLYIDGGISNGIAVSESSYIRVESQTYSIKNISESSLIDPRKWERGVLLGLGSNIKSFSFEFRFERADGMSRYVDSSSPVKRYFFILGYKF